MNAQLSTLILAAALGQVPAESGWLDSVPAEADVVLRVRGLGAAKGDLLVMLKAMSPALAAKAEPVLEQVITEAKAQAGEQVLAAPFLVLLRGVPSDEPGSVPYALVVKSADYEAVLKSVAGGKDPGTKRLGKGYDSFNGPGGKTWYAAKGDGTVAFGGDRTLIGGFTKPGATSLGKTTSPNLREKFLAGDAGIYVNVNALAARYKDSIAKAEQGFFAAFDQLGPQLGSGMTGFFKSFYGGLFASIKEADRFALSVDFGGEGLGMSALLTVKGGSKAAKMIAEARTGDAARLAKLSADSSFYGYLNTDAELFRSLWMMSLQMLTHGGKVSPELAGAIAKERGRIESVSTMTFDNGIKSFQLTDLADPRSFAEAYSGMVKLMKDADSPLNFMKEIVSTPAAETYRGFTFTRIEMTVDLDKFAKLQPGNPNAAAAMKAMYGGDKVTTWMGVGPTQLIQVVAASWADARSQIDGYFAGGQSIGSTAGFRSTRAQLPKEASFVGMMSAQGLVRQLVAQISILSPQAPKLPPGDMPGELALIGFSLSPSAPSGIEFQMFVPATVGPVFEKGLEPVFSAWRPPVKP